MSTPTPMSYQDYVKMCVRLGIPIPPKWPQAPRQQTPVSQKPPLIVYANAAKLPFDYAKLSPVDAVKAVAKAACGEYQIELGDLTSQRRCKKLADIRRKVIWLVNDITGLDYRVTGRALALRNERVWDALMRVNGMMGYNASVKKELMTAADKICTKLNIK